MLVRRRDGTSGKIGGCASAGFVKSARGRARAPQAAFGGLRQQRGFAALPFCFASRNKRARARPADFAAPMALPLCPYELRSAKKIRLSESVRKADNVIRR